MVTAQYNRLNVHVGASNVTVVRRARRMLSRIGRARDMRGERHKWLRAILKEHASAGALFRKFRF
jgi:hypothetical protein